MGVKETGKSVILTTESGASAEIKLFGATVTSWKQGGKERLFVSSKSAMDSSKPIRGGIPVVFPIFGPAQSSYPPAYASLPQHGFARTLDWTLEKTVMDRSEGVSVRFACPTPPNFAPPFKLAYVVTLSKHQLSTDLHITNTSDSEDFIFQALLHSYLAVPDIRKISIKGLDAGITYTDKTQNMKEVKWDGGELKISAETDRVYKKVPSQHLELDDGEGSSLKIRFKGFEDAVTWNPSEGGNNMADMEQDGYKRFVCVEPGYVSEFKTLKPGEEFLGQQILTAEE
ncbi:glucose-6-phosphate 1-epimerase, partial [Tremellales sp. Uapishka_1]